MAGHPVRATLIRGLLKATFRLIEVFIDTLAVGIHCAEVALSAGVTLTNISNKPNFQMTATMRLLRYRSFPYGTPSCAGTLKERRVIVKTIVKM